ncbi:MAG: biotin/lipoyl-binding protein [Alphaproteobacteria bacterium]|nr:biotin/lipoyl-binding protein [Alphaproteobacteria bacterium]
MKKKKVILPLVLALAGLYGAWYFVSHRGQEQTDDAAIEAHVVPLIPKVSGYVAAVHFKDNQDVKKGDLLIEIAPEDYEIKVQQAKAALAALQPQIDASTATLSTTQTMSSTMMQTAQSAVKAAEANLAKTRNELERLRKMDDRFRSRKQLDDAVSAEHDAQSRLEEAKAQLKNAATAPNNVAVAEAGVGRLKAQVMEAQAALDAAEQELSYTKIYAADDGHISNRTVEPGAYVQPGQMLAALVTKGRWVVANYKETQLEDIRPGQKAEIRIDAYPKILLKGHVDSIQRGTGAVFSAFPPENATGNYVKIVQRVPVKIVLDTPVPAGVVLGPGMSVVPVVYTGGK